LSQTKVYDNNTSVADTTRYSVGTMVGSESLSGVTLAYSDENVSRQGGTATGTVLSNKTIEVSAARATVGTTVLSDYAISYVSDTASTITPYAVTVTALSQTKVYDSNTSVADTTRYSVGAMVQGESLSTVTLAYDSKDAGTRTITASNAVAGNNTVLSNYNVQYASNAVSSITPYAVSLTGGRVYDATTSVAASVLTIGQLVGAETLTISGAGVLQDPDGTGILRDKDVGTGKAFDIGTLSLAGAGSGATAGLASNYTLVGGTRVASITRATISTVTGITATNKTYDGNATASLVTSGALFTGMLSSDVLNVATSAGVFNDPRAAIGKTVSISGITLGGADAGNYTLTTSTASTTATIDPKALTVTALSQTKV
jgi:hypothetical protein